MRKVLDSIGGVCALVAGETTVISIFPQWSPYSWRGITVDFIIMMGGDLADRAQLFSGKEVVCPASGAR